MAIREVLRPTEVRHLAVEARRHACACHQHTVEGAACFVRGLGIRYLADPPRRDHWCTPAETLRRGVGDCDDFSILAASLLIALGADAHVVLGWHASAYHAWVAGRCQCGEFFVLEPQSGQVWDRVPTGYDAEYVIGLDACWRVRRDMSLVAAA